MTTAVFPTGETGMEWARALIYPKSLVQPESKIKIYIDIYKITIKL